MSPRRTITVLGPAAALGALALGIGCGCVSWMVDAPGIAAHVGHGLTRDYGVSLAAKGPLRLSLLPLPSLGFHDVRLSAGGPDGPALVEGGTLSIQLNLSALLLGRTEIVALALDGAHVALPEREGDRRWEGPLRRLAARLAEPGAAHPRRVTLNDVTLAAGGAEARDLDVTLSWPLWSDRLQLDGSLLWHGIAARFACTKLSPVDLAAGGTSPFAANVTWAAGQLAAEGSATLGNAWSVAGQGAFETASLPETLAWIGREMALAPLVEALALEGSFEADPQGLRMPKLRVRAGGTALDGAAAVELGGDRPSIRATLDTDVLNLGPVAAGALRVAGLDGTEGGWGRQPLALGPLTGGDLDLRLSGRTARLGPMRLENLAANVFVRGDSIDATLARANLEDGTVKGHVAITAPRGTNADETEIKAQGVFTGLDLGALLVEAGESGWLLGSTRGTFALEGKGRDAQSLVERITGRANLAMDGGAIAGLDLADVIHRGGTVARGALARRNGRTSFERLGVALAFADGIGTITEGDLTARALTATLRGHLSLPAKQFRARVALRPRSTDAAGETAAGPSAQFEIAGPWDAVSVHATARQRAGDANPTPGDGLRMPSPETSTLPVGARAYLP